MSPKKGFPFSGSASLGADSCAVVEEMLRLDRGVDLREVRGDPGRLVLGLSSKLDGLVVLGDDGGVVTGLDWPRSPKMLGSRWPNGRIALNMCVTIVAPAPTAA